MSAVRLNTVRNRLLLLFFAITAGAIVFVYLYVVPQLDSNLTAQRLERLQTVGSAQSERINAAMKRGASQAELRRVIRGVAQKTDARVTVLGVASTPSGYQPDFVIGDSELERSAMLPSYPAAASAASGVPVASAVERVGGQRIGETAVLGSLGGQPRWVTVLSIDLRDVDDNVALIRRQILIAGAIAIAAALAAGWFAARAHARRLRRLEEAAEKVAEGDFRTPIPVDSADRGGSARAELQRDAEAPRPPRQRPQGVHRQRLRTSCAHPSSPWVGSWSCSRTRSPTRPRAPSSSAPCADRSTG